MTTILQELRNSNLKKLVITRIERRFLPGTKVTSEQVSKLPRNLTHLIASGNNINALDSGVMSNLPNTLQYLDVSGNKMVFGSYLKNFSLLENLEILKVDGNEDKFGIPLQYPSPFQRQIAMEHQISVVQSPENKHRRPHHDMVFHLPPKLRVLTMDNAGLRYYLSKLNFSANNSLQRLHLHGNVFPSAKGPFIGLNNLKYLILSQCSIREIHKKFFEHFPSLEFLDLSNNLIGLGRSLMYAPFKYLTNLKSLHLYYNGIRALRNDTFLGLSSIEELFLERNSFYYFNTSISHMKRLRTLNLTRTMINKLLPETRKQLDSLNDVKVYMQETPIKCACPNLDFLEWMTRSKAIPTNTSYKCVLGDLTVKLNLPWGSFLHQVSIVKRECISNFDVFVPVLGATLLFFVAIIGSVAYRYRWRLRYFYYGLDVRLDTRGKIDKGEFKYDVFVSYCSDDLDFVMSNICPVSRRINQKGPDLDWTENGKSYLQDELFQSSVPLLANVSWNPLFHCPSSIGIDPRSHQPFGAFLDHLIGELVE